MMQEGQHQGRENEVWWFQVRIWSMAVISIAFLSACFILSCVVNYHITHDRTEKRLSELGTHYSSLTCFREKTRVTEKDWSCCPQSWKSFSLNCYFISTEYRNWTESEKNCSGMKAHLLVINTKEEQDFITQNMDETKSYHVGLSDPEGKGVWQWVDQTPYNEIATFWHPGEPSDPAERCVILNKHTPNSWGWNDVPCQDRHMSICKMMKIYL